MYEKLARFVKVTLRKTEGWRLYNFESLQTVLTEADDVINSRPLPYVYSEPSEPGAQMPASFLIGKRISALPLAVNREESSFGLSLWANWQSSRVQLEEFWKRRTKEYLLELRIASKTFELALL